MAFSLVSHHVLRNRTWSAVSIQSNATDPACPIVGVGAGGPEYDLKTCTQAAAQTAVGANYSTYLFADNFHPSPFTYTVVASEILSEMSIQGW